MPTLLIHHSGQSRGVVLSGRLLIGRVAPAGVVLADPSVSRIHAWIDKVGDRYYIADAGSRSGTIVDQSRIAARHTLLDGDEIRIGSATITYSDHDELPGDVSQLSIAHSNGVPLPAAGGILFACGCGAPLWAPLDWVGRRGKCALCGQRTPVPSLGSSRPAAPPAITGRPASAPATRPAAAPALAATRQCSICQWAIEPADEQTACPTCGLTFHAECWHENKGCSAYGCASVEILAEPAAQTEPAVVETIAEEPPERFPVEFAMLGGSVFCSLIGLLAFGVPSILLAVVTVTYWIAHRRRGEPIRNGIVAAAMAMCVTGIFAGLWYSAFLWLHRPLTAPWQAVS